MEPVIDRADASEAEAYFEALQMDLIRLQPGETLARSNESLELVLSDDIERDSVIMSMSVLAGCDIAWDCVIERDPEVRGVAFTRRSDLPLLEATECEGEA